MTTLPALIKHDLRLQWRYGIHIAYGAVVALYAVTLVSARAVVPDWLVAFLIYSDPSALGFFFLGGLMLLERNEGARGALAVSPMSARVYLASKALTLTAIAMVAVVALGVARGGVQNWGLLLCTVVLTSVFFIGIGAMIAMHLRTVNAYLIGSALMLTPLIAPGLLAFLDPMPIGAAIIPAVSQLRLMLVALGFGAATAIELAIMIGVTAIAAAAAYAMGERRLQSEFGRK